MIAGPGRHRLDGDQWRAVAATMTTLFQALWGDDGAVVALLRENDQPMLVSVPVEQGFYPAFSPWRPEAAMFERMIRDVWGYSAVGGTDDRPWLDFGQWRMAAPMGRPSAPFAAPETATSGFAHKGTLALMRGKSPRVAARFASRVDGMAAVAHSVAFALAAERAAGAPAPARAAALRAVMLRMERMAGGLETIRRVAEAAETGLLAGQASVLREAVARAAAASFGHRLMMDCVVPGGVVVDMAADGPGALAWLGAEVAAADLPALAAASLGRRLAGLPAVGARMAEAVAAVTGAVPAIQALMAGLKDGPVLRTALAMEGEGIGVERGPGGEILHWLRLEGGQIGGAFVLDPAWVNGPACAAEMAAAAMADRALVAASWGVLASGMEL